MQAYIHLGKYGITRDVYIFQEGKQFSTTTKIRGDNEKLQTSAEVNCLRTNTRTRVKIMNGLTEDYQTTKGVRQGCCEATNILKLQITVYSCIIICEGMRLDTKDEIMFPSYCSPGLRCICLYA